MGRSALILAALVFAALSVADYLSWRANRQRLLALAGESGLLERRPAAGGPLSRETVPTRATTLLAWSLLELEFDRAWLAELSPEERAAEAGRGIERLRLARRLAEEALARRPAAWRAATVIGGSRYLETTRLRRAEPAPADWREPLAAAMGLAPNHSEPTLLLAAAELSRWSSLSPAERERVLPVLARAFRDRRGLDLLLARWIRVAPSLERLLEPIPDDAAAWARLGRELLEAGDLERFAVARGRWLAALPASLAERVEGGRARLRAGDRRRAVTLLRPVLAAPHGLEVADSFSAALALLPQRVESGRTGQHLRRWLLWALDLCALGRCPLGGETLATLAGRLADPAAVELALTAIAGDDLAGARRHEPAPAANGEDPRWNRYWIYRAQRLLPDDPQSAGRALARAAAAPPDELRYWHAAARLAEAAGDAAGRDRARAALDRLAGPEVSQPSWWRHGRVVRLELTATAPAAGLKTALAGIPPDGAAVELRWDGRSAGIAALYAGEPHRWRLEIAPGLHLVEIESLTGRPPTPIALTLEAAPAQD